MGGSGRGGLCFAVIEKIGGSAGGAFIGSADGTRRTVAIGQEETLDHAQVRSGTRPDLPLRSGL